METGRRRSNSLDSVTRSSYKAKTQHGNAAVLHEKPFSRGDSRIHSLTTNTLQSKSRNLTYPPRIYSGASRLESFPSSILNGKSNLETRPRSWSLDSKSGSDASLGEITEEEEDNLYEQEQSMEQEEPEMTIEEEPSVFETVTEQKTPPSSMQAFTLHKRWDPIGLAGLRRQINVTPTHCDTTPRLRSPLRSVETADKYSTM